MTRPSALLAGALLAGCASATGTSGSSTGSPVPARAAVAVAPTGKAFAVAPPEALIAHISGPAPLQQAPCQASAVSASAQTKQANDGVLGLITLVGRSCSLSVNPAGLRLLDASGRPLPVSTTPARVVNPASSIRPELSEANGSVRVGFAWTGSFCGPAPVMVQIPALPAAIRVPFRGPVPACTSSRAGDLIPGVVAGPQAPVEPAPAAWVSLRARLVIPKTVAEGPIPLSVVLTTVGTTNVSLAAPCPGYLITLNYPTAAGRGFGGGGHDFMGDFGDLCSRPLVVRPGHPLTLTIPSVHYTPEGPWQPGATLTAQWAIAGVSTATATATIR